MKTKDNRQACKGEEQQDVIFPPVVSYAFVRVIDRPGTKENVEHISQKTKPPKRACAMLGKTKSIRKPADDFYSSFNAQACSVALFPSAYLVHKSSQCLRYRSTKRQISDASPKYPKLFHSCAHNLAVLCSSSTDSVSVLFHRRTITAFWSPGSGNRATDLQPCALGSILAACCPSCPAGPSAHSSPHV